MATALTKKVIRRTDEYVREAGKFRRLVVTLYPSGMIGLRPEKTRREELYPLSRIYFAAVRDRVTREKADKKKKGGKK